MTDLIRPALYQAYHKIENITSEEPNETYDVVVLSVNHLMFSAKLST